MARIEWFTYEVGHIRRRRLHINGNETPFFVDTALASFTRSMGEKHGLYGSGMDRSGGAKLLNFGPHLKPLKLAALRMAGVDI